MFVELFSTFYQTHADSLVLTAKTFSKHDHMFTCLFARS